MSSHRFPGIKAQFVVFIFITLVLVLILTSITFFSEVFRKLGFPPEYSVYFLFLSLLGSQVNLPVGKVTSSDNTTIIAINLGGAVIPLVLAVFLSTMASLVEVIIGGLIVTVIIHRITKPVKGSGIAIHMLLPPFLAVATALVISPANAPLIAYVSGTFGCLIGIDLLNLKKIPGLGVPFVSIGGGGTFDAIFTTGILSVMLAWV